MTTRPTTWLGPSRAVATGRQSPDRWPATESSLVPGLTRRRAGWGTPPATGPSLPLNRPADMPDGFSLRGLLVCGACDRPLRPIITPAGGRAYRSTCGCGPDAVDAATVERLVRDVVDRHSAALVADAPPAALGEVFRALFATVRVGDSAEELSPVWRF